MALVNGDQASDLGLLIAAGTDALLPRAIDVATLGRRRELRQPGLMLAHACW